MRFILEKLLSTAPWERLLLLAMYSALYILVIGLQLCLFMLCWMWQLFQEKLPHMIYNKCHQLNLLAYDISQYLSNNSDQHPGPF